MKKEVIAPEIGGTPILSSVNIWKQEWTFFHWIQVPSFLEALQGGTYLGEREMLDFYKTWMIN